MMSTNPRTLSDEVREVRKPDYDIDPLFVNRWSPRAMTGEPLSDEELFSLLEAARWAPSSSNAQPWRFIISRRGSASWETFLSLLVEGNRLWAKQAGVLMVIISRKRMEYKERPNPVHTFDTGSAWMSLALEGARRGLVVHGMAGFDYEKAREVLKIPDLFKVEAMAAIGHRGDPKTLPEQLQEREHPSDRKPVSELVFEDTFPASEKA